MESKQENMKVISIILPFLFIIGFSSCNQSSENSLENAETYYFQMETFKALEMYQTLWSDTSLNTDVRKIAGQQLATMHWLLLNEAQKSFDLLENLELLGDQNAQTYLIWSRVLGEEERFDESMRMAKKALTVASSKTEKYDSKIGFAKALLSRETQFITSAATIENQVNSGDLQLAYEVIQDIFENNPGDINVAKVFLGLCIITNRYREAYDAWLSYYRADSEGNVHVTLSESQRNLKQAWLEGNMSSKKHAEIAVQGLVQSGFFKYATLLAMKTELDKSHSYGISDLFSYYSFLQQVKGHTLLFYRDEVKGTSSQNDYETNIERESKKLWSSLTWSGDKPFYSDKLFKDELEKRFKTIIRFMNANGHFGLSMGHVVLDEERKVKQYGKEGILRYIAIDHMVSNGYSSWYWDGIAQIGGWAPDEFSILQVRDAYISGPIKAWQTMSDTIEREKVKKEIAEKSVDDDLIADKNPYAYLPGLSKRVYYNSICRLHDELKSEGFEGAELRKAFIGSYEKLILESSIFAHEGRHAIDKKYNGSMRGKEFEFRAKLSEIYFSDRPFLALNAILSQNIGDGTDHGDANQKVLKGIVTWMEKNQSEIEGFDENRPYLPQLDLLTDSQLKEAVNFLDPLAK